MSAPISLNIEPKFSLSETAASAGNTIKGSLNWIIDKVKLVASSIIGFLRDTALPFAKDVTAKTVAFLRTNAGAAVLGATATGGLLYAAYTVDGEKNKILQVGLFIAAAATAALSITATVFGAKNGFNANIV